MTVIDLIICLYFIFL